MDAAITVKGTRDGLLITLGPGDTADLFAELANLVDSNDAFFRGGKVALQVVDHRLSFQDVTHLCQLFEERNIRVWAILGTDATTRSAAEKLGLKTDLARPPAKTEDKVPVPEFIAGTGILVQRTLRSGQAIRHPGHVVIIGDVNPGAEVIAGGDVIVWGHLRGIVHAGATGERDRCVCALDLSPMQLRIGNHIARPPEDKRRNGNRPPERAFVSNGQIVAERWK